MISGSLPRLAYPMRVLLFAALLPLQVSGQINLYVNKFTGEYTSYKGQYSKTTDKYTRGVLNVTTEGPIAYKVDPADLLIFENQTRSWKGNVYPDMANVPIPGTFKDAKLIGDYSVTFARPQGSGSGGTVQETWTCGVNCPNHPGGGGTHELVNKTGKNEALFRVYSLYLALPDTVKICKKKVEIEAEGWPEGGEYTWTITSAPNFIYSLKTDRVLEADFDMYKPHADATIEVEYKVGGLTIKRKCHVKIPNAREELKEIKDLMNQAFANGVAKGKLPNVGSGWTGNVKKTFSDNYVKCTDVIDVMQTEWFAVSKNKKFCCFKVGALVYDGIYINAHIYLGLADRNGKVIAYWDPWRHGDATLRKITTSQPFDEFVPWH